MGTLDTKKAYEKATTIDNVFSNTDTFPKTVLTASAGKRIIVQDAVLGVANLTSGTYVIITLQAQTGSGTYVNVMPIAAGPQSAQVVEHNFEGRVQTNIGGILRLTKSGNSSSFQGVFTGTGFVE